MTQYLLSFSKRQKSLEMIHHPHLIISKHKMCKKQPTHILQRPKYFLSIYYVPGTARGNWDIIMNEIDKYPHFMEVAFW